MTSETAEVEKDRVFEEIGRSLRRSPGRREISSKES